MIVDSMKLIGDPYFYNDIRMVRLQRQVNDGQCGYFLNFLKPLSEKVGFWLVYEVDDVIKYEDIPLYNHGRNAYANQIFFSNVKNMLKACDFLTVTCSELKKYYVDVFEIDEEKVIVIPNYLPRWWIGEAYDVERLSKRFTENEKKPRIMFPMSSSHFDLTGTNNYIDDFTEMSEFMRANLKNYHFSIVGHAPKIVEDLIRDKKIEVTFGSDLLNYPRELSQRSPQAVIAPLRDNIFNTCKSNIKLLESWALGFPVVAQDLPCYSPYTDLVFKDNNQLQNKLDSLFVDKKRYMKMVKENRHIVDFGDNKHAPTGWWIEKNLQTWYSLFTLPQKTLQHDLRNFMKAVQNAEKAAEKDKKPEEEISINLS